MLEDQRRLVADGAAAHLLQPQEAGVEGQRAVQVADAEHGVGEAHDTLF